MMLKCVAFSPSVPGKAYSLSLRNDGRLKVLSTSLGGISAAFRPPAKHLTAAPFSVNRVDEFAPRDSQALFAETFKLRPVDGKANMSQEGNAQDSHGKKVHFDYHVTGIPGDGRCLFRAVAHGSCLRSGRPAPDATTQRQMADDLRNRALDELVNRRETSEWFIEGDFDAYVKRMRKSHTWGGEPELLMLSNVLEMPITVYMRDKGGIISIAEYGQEHGNGSPIRVLYDGSGHYEALHFPQDKQMSRL